MPAIINSDDGVVSGSSGLKTSGANDGILALQNNGTTNVTVTAAGNVGIGTSSPSGKLDVVLSDNGNVDIRQNSANSTGFLNWVDSDGGRAGRISYDHSNNSLRFATNETERARIDSSGNLLVGTTSGSDRFMVKSTGTSSTASAITIQNSAGTELMRIRNDGVFYTGGATFSPYNNTTASAANVVVGASGDLFRSTSSLKYKQDVADATHGLAELMQLRPVTYKGKSEADGNKVFGGLIAEEVHQAGLTEFVQYAEDGSPDAIAYGNMVSLCIKAIQELKAELDATKAEVAALKAAAK